MNCPLCLHDKASTILTIPANKRGDGKTYRRRKCKKCSKEFSTLELYLQDAKALRDGEEGFTDHLPDSRPMDGPIIDIEEALEKMLQPSIASINAVLVPGNQVSRQRVETAKWVIQDRREQRRMWEASSGQPKESEQLRELGKLLSLVPDVEDDEKAS
jgi:hypothetical protein